MYMYYRLVLYFHHSSLNLALWIGKITTYQCNSSSFQQLITNVWWYNYHYDNLNCDIYLAIKSNAEILNMKTGTIGLFDICGGGRTVDNWLDIYI